jgi:hypothetical protein
MFNKKGVETVNAQTVRGKVGDEPVYDPTKAHGSGINNGQHNKSD